MNLSGIFNLPELNRSQGAGSAQPAQTSATASTLASSEPNGGKTDQASLSASGLVAAQSAAPDGSASDVRMEKVASVSAAIQAGTYSVSPLDVADKIMQGMFDVGQR
ncbi:MAG: flagellar biosynthesis anti-sigma factor FlgM [Acidobacteriaceae bacterium]